MIDLKDIKNNIGFTGWKDKVDQYAKYCQATVMIWNGKTDREETDSRGWYGISIFGMTPKRALLTEEEREKAMAKRVMAIKVKLLRRVEKEITKEQISNWQYLKGPWLEYDKPNK